MGEGFSDGKPSIEIRPELGDTNAGIAAEGQPADVLEPGSKEVKKLFTDAAQRHHDYYVGLQMMGELPEEDRPQFELAMKREEDGEVQALTFPDEQEEAK